jgi:hypothetical protein
MAFAGDSIIEGVRASGVTAEPAGHGRSSAWFVGQGMAAEYGVLGYGSQGWENAGAGGIPNFPTAWASHTTGRPRTWTGIDYYFVMHGYNGITTQGDVQSWISAARATLGATCWIFVVCAPSGKAAAVTAAAVAAYKAATPTDTKVALIDYSDRISLTSFNNAVGAAFYEAIDGVHPLEFANAEIAASIVDKARAIIDTATASPPISFVIDAGGGVGVTRSGELVEIV